MSKRRNENGQIRREEYEHQMEDEDDSNPGVFQRASAEQLQKRRIVKAVRRSKPENVDGNRGGVLPPLPQQHKPPPSTTNPFAGFHGLVDNGPAASTPSPFLGFTGLTKNGGSIPKNSNPLASETPTKNLSSELNFTTPSSSKVKESSTSSGGYEESISSLNESFYVWVQDQLKENPQALWIEAIKEYIKYAHEIQSKFPKEKQEIKTTFSTFNPLTAPDFSVASAASSGSTFGNGFQGFQNLTTQPKTTFSSGFTFQAQQPPAATTTTTSTKTNGGLEVEALDEDEQVGHEEATVVIKAENKDEDELIEIEKCRLFVFKKEENNWVSKGETSLKVLQHRKTKKARILLRDFIGKVVLNASVYKDLKVNLKLGKEDKKMGVSLLLFVEDNKLEQFYIRVKEELVDSLKRILEQSRA